jgi:Kef-type K+ transport system membrane component KefB
MLLLGFVTSLQSSGDVAVLSLLLLLLQAVAFVVLIAMLGAPVMRRSSSMLEVPINPHSPLTICLALCLGLVAAASSLGLAAIIGAFLAGMIAAETQQQHTLEKQLQLIVALVVPFFFVVTGAKVDLGQLGRASAIGTLMLVTALAIVGKFIGCGLAALSLGRRPAFIVGVGMVPRGEVGIIVASLGQQMHVFGDRLYAIIIAMALLTSVVAPPVLGQLLANRSKMQQ